jgi:diketogulonate reductase-like aldo/keto reductase
VVPVPKSTSKAHIEENASIFDFTLPLDEMRAIDRLPLTAFTGLDPDTVNY